MRNLILPVILATSLGLSSMAMAATNNTTDGTIKALDAKACTVTLSNKVVYHFAAKCDLSKFSLGEKVAVTWHAYKKMDVGTSIAAVTAKAAAPMAKTTIKTTATKSTTVVKK